MTVQLKCIDELLAGLDAADDLEGAVQQLSRLTGAPRAVAQPWINDAQRRIEIDRRGTAVVVPHRSVQWDGKRWVVFVPAGEAAFAPREVRPGIRDGDMVEIGTFEGRFFIAMALGHIYLGTIGMDAISGTQRLTFGLLEGREELRPERRRQRRVDQAVS